MRDIVAEIQALRARETEKGVRNALPEELAEIARYAKSIARNPQRITKEERVAVTFYVVRMVALIQSIFRQHAAAWIDQNPTKLGRFSKLRDIKISLDDLEHFVGRRLSPGEYIAHSMKISSVDDLFVFGEMLMEKGFSQTLRSQYTELYAKTSSSEFDTAISRIADLFRVRNEICHEGGFPEPLTGIQISLQLSNAVTIIVNAVSLFKPSLRSSIFERVAQQRAQEQANVSNAAPPS